MFKFKKKICLLLVLTTSLMVPISASASVNSIRNDVTIKMDSMENQIKKEVQDLTNCHEEKWNKITIVNKTPLYDFNNKLIAFCFDLNNDETNKKGYVIVSNNPADSGILEFGDSTYSKYMNQAKVSTNGLASTGNIKYIYGSACSYFSESTSLAQGKNRYVDLTSKKELKDDEIKVLTNEAKNRSYKSSPKENIVNNSKSLAANYAAPTYYKVIPNVPDLNWHYGCAPTSAAMVIMSRYHKYPQGDTLIEGLAYQMRTSNGATSCENYARGINAEFEVDGINGYSYNESNSFSKSDSTFGKYVNEIDRNYALMASVLDNTMNFPGTTKHYGNHSMAGVGYQYSNTNSFIIVHDTAQDGNVYLDYYASSFGRPLWTYIHY